MKIKVEIDNIIQSYVKMEPDALNDLEVADKTTIDMLLKQLKIPSDQIGMIIRNNRALFNYETVLEPDDQITIFSEINGG